MVRAGASGIAPSPGPAELARRRVPDSRLTLEGETLTCSACVPGLIWLGIYCLGNLLQLVSLGPPSPHLTRHPCLPSLSTPPGLGGALLSAPGLPSCRGRAYIFPAMRAPPAQQVSTRSPEAQSSSSGASLSLYLRRLPPLRWVPG